MSLLIALLVCLAPPDVTACLEADVAGMACVPGGPGFVGTDEPHACPQDESVRRKTKFGPRLPVWVQTFYMDKTEVTNAAYKACVQRGKCRKVGPNYSDFGGPEQPITALSWNDARTYCAAMGKRLPTEAEWERAAEGPDVGCPDVVVMNDEGRSCGMKKKGKDPEVGRVMEVGKTPPGAFGLFEMRGNAEEWVDDWFVADRENCPSCVGEDPRGPCAGQLVCARTPLKMVKGGSWYWPAEHARGWHRRPWVPSNQPAHHFGFRCAASVEQAAAHR